MGALGIVIMKIEGQSGVAFGDTGILPEEDIFIFYVAPETFDADVVYTTTLEQQVKVTLDSDIPTLVPTITGSSIKKITKLFAFIARSVPYIPNYRQLKTLIDVSDERTLKHYLKLLEDSGLIVGLPRYIKGLKRLEEIGKIVLNDPNLLWALSPIVESGTVRETFVVSMLRCLYDVALPERGDFLIEIAGNPVVFEVGGQKGRRQIDGVRDWWVFCTKSLILPHSQ